MLDQDFFQRDTPSVAHDLIGCYLVVDGETYMITETEGYLGEEDSASHARFGRTKRSQVMYGLGGIMYVYLIYGMHHMLNIVTESVDQPGAVLIRGVAGFDGPGKLTRGLGITKEDHNGKALSKETGIWINSRADDFTTDDIITTKRVGINYATDEWREAQLRFTLVKG